MVYAAAQRNAAAPAAALAESFEQILRKNPETRRPSFGFDAQLTSESELYDFMRSCGEEVEERMSKYTAGAKAGAAGVQTAFDDGTFRAAKEAPRPAPDGDSASSARASTCASSNDSRCVGGLRFLPQKRESPDPAVSLSRAHTLAKAAEDRLARAKN
jgi:hypothetical protein